MTRVFGKLLFTRFPHISLAETGARCSQFARERKEQVRSVTFIVHPGSNVELAARAPRSPIKCVARLPVRAIL